MKKLYCYITNSIYPTLCFGDSERILSLIMHNKRFDNFLYQIAADKLVNPDTGEKLRFDKSLDIINYIVKKGWNIEQTSPYWIFSKEANSCAEAIDNIVTENIFALRHNMDDKSKLLYNMLLKVQDNSFNIPALIELSNKLADCLKNIFDSNEPAFDRILNEMADNNCRNILREYHFPIPESLIPNLICVYKSNSK